MLDNLVYRIDINQGNYIVEQDITKLRAGMSGEQVRFVLGSPMIVESHAPNTWYYIYHHQPAHGETVQKNLILEFDNQGKLLGYYGDYTPDSNFYTPVS